MEDVSTMSGEDENPSHDKMNSTEIDVVNTSIQDSAVDTEDKGSPHKTEGESASEINMPSGGNAADISQKSEDNGEETVAEAASEEEVLSELIREDKPSRDDIHEGNMMGKKFTTYDVYQYLTNRIYPTSCTSKNIKSNFRTQCEPFVIINGVLHHKTHRGKGTDRGRDTESFPEYARVIFTKAAQSEIVHIVHEGRATSLEAKSLSAHRGINSGLDIIARRVWWPRYSKDYKDHVKVCDPCQKVNTAVIKVKDPLCSVAPPRQNLKQIGVDIIQLPEADGLKYVVVAIDYLSKYCHAKALENKSAGEVARFLFEWICLFGCPKIVINDQGREFVNEVSGYLYRMTGVHQRMTSAYNPQANGQVERQNAVIKCGLLKVLRQNISKWPSVLDGVLFAHRVQKQRSTGYSPFFLLFGQEPTLPLDVWSESLNDKDEEDDMEIDIPDVTLDTYMEKIEGSESIDVADLQSLTAQFVSLKEKTLLKARGNIKDAQNTQRKEYDRRNNADGTRFKSGQTVLRRNLRRDDRKGDWSQDPWLGPYTIAKVLKFRNKTKCVLRSVLTGRVLKQTYTQKNLKLYHSKIENKLKKRGRSKTKKMSEPNGQSEQSSYKLNDNNCKESYVNNSRKRESVWESVSEDSSEENESKPRKKQYDENIILSDNEGQDDNLHEGGTQYHSPDLYSSPTEMSNEDIQTVFNLPDDRSVITYNSITILASDLKRLQENMYLNDNILNYYFKLVSENEERVYAFPTHFYTVLAERGYESTAKWNKNVDIFGMKYLLIPIHKPSHWSLCVVNNTEKTVTVYDSLSRRHDDSIKIIINYLEKKAKDAQVNIDFREYRSSHAEHIAVQNNGYDCGVCICFYARRVVQDKACSGSSSYFAKLRILMLKEIVACQLLPEELTIETYTVEEIFNPTKDLYNRDYDNLKTNSEIKGIQNLGNTCFLSATLQVLFHSAPFITWLEEDHNHRSTCDTCLACVVFKTYQAYKTGRSLDPKEFVGRLKNFWESYETNRQQDAHEFLSVLLESLHSEYLERTNYESLTVTCMVTTPIYNAFGGFIQTEVTCGQCTKVSITISPFTALSLSTVGESLEDCFRDYFREEIVDITCSNCGCNRLKKKLTLLKPPKVLILQLKRFTVNNKKVTKAIKENMHISPSCVLSDGKGKEMYASCQYGFLGSVRHLSKGCESGHYIATIRVNKRYYCINDTEVASITQRSAFRGDAYMVFYERLSS